MVHEGLLQTARCTKDRGAGGVAQPHGADHPIASHVGVRGIPPLPPLSRGVVGRSLPPAPPAPDGIFHSPPPRGFPLAPPPPRAPAPKPRPPFPGVPCGGKMAAAMAAGLSRLGRGVRGLCGPLNGAGAEEPCEERRGGLRGAPGSCGDGVSCGAERAERRRGGGGV